MRHESRQKVQRAGLEYGANAGVMLLKNAGLSLSADPRKLHSSIRLLGPLYFPTLARFSLGIIADLSV
jgi:hypothetical protein